MLCGGLITTLIDEKDTIKATIFKFRFVFISIILACISYKIALDYLKISGKASQDAIQTTMVEFSEIPNRILQAIKIGFTNLVQYDFAFFSPVVTSIFTLILLLCIISFCVSKLKILAKFAILILFFGMILSSQIHVIVSNFIMSLPRVEYYGLLLVRVLLVAFAFKLCLKFTKLQKLAQSVIFALCFIAIWISAVQNLYAQRTQKLAFDAELKLLDRVIARIEMDENFSYEKQYCGITFGLIQNIRQKLYPNGDNTRDGGDMLGHRIIPEWDATEAFKYSMQKDIFHTCKFFVAERQYDKNNTKFDTLLKRLDNAGILDILEPWPHKNSVVVFEDIIVFVASKGNLDEIRTLAKTLPDSSNKDK